MYIRFYFIFFWHNNSNNNNNNKINEFIICCDTVYSDNLWFSWENHNSGNTTFHVQKPTHDFHRWVGVVTQMRKCVNDICCETINDFDDAVENWWIKRIIYFDTYAKCVVCRAEKVQIIKRGNIIDRRKQSAYTNASVGGLVSHVDCTMYTINNDIVIMFPLPKENIIMWTLFFYYLLLGVFYFLEGFFRFCFDSFGK